MAELFAPVFWHIALVAVAAIVVFGTLQIGLAILLKRVERKLLARKKQRLKQHIDP